MRLEPAVAAGGRQRRARRLPLARRPRPLQGRDRGRESDAGRSASSRGRCARTTYWGAFPAIRPTLGQAVDQALTWCREQAKRPEACGIRLTFCADGSHSADVPLAPWPDSDNGLSSSAPAATGGRAMSTRRGAASFPRSLAAAAARGGARRRRACSAGSIRCPGPGSTTCPRQVIGYGLGASGVAAGGWGAVTLYRAGTNVLPHQRRRPAGHARRLRLSPQSHLHGRGADLPGAGAGHGQHLDGDHGAAVRGSPCWCLPSCPRSAIWRRASVRTILPTRPARGAGSEHGP